MTIEAFLINGGKLSANKPVTIAMFINVYKNDLFDEGWLPLDTKVQTYPHGCSTLGLCLWDNFGHF